MKLIIHPAPPLPVFETELELVIRVGDDPTPEVHVKQGVPKPDRHLLLGIVQSVAMAVTERDCELVAFMNTTSIVLDLAGSRRELPPGLIVARGENGQVAVLATEDARHSRTLARQALRYFTGTIRLDIP